MPNFLILDANLLGKNSWFIYLFSREQQKPTVKELWSSPEEDGLLVCWRAEHRQGSALSDKRTALLQEGRAVRGTASISSTIKDEIMGQVWGDHRDSFRSDRRQGWIRGCYSIVPRLCSSLGPEQQGAGVGSGTPSQQGSAVCPGMSFMKPPSP